MVMPGNLLPLFLFFTTCLAESFLTIGDWGGYDLGNPYRNNQLAVASAMGKSAADSSISFIVNVGDNFYYIGVSNTTDPQWNDDFENVYTASSLMVPWYSALGNHDYGNNPDAQLQYKSPNNNRWVMPERYYTERIQLSGGYVTFVFIDTSPCISDYRSDNPNNWDPPADEAPNFHPNIMAQNCTTQYNWLKSTLASVDPTDWLIVVGHHPADEIDVEDMTSLMQNSTMDLYLCGHSHLLELYNIDGKATPYVISGAGCYVNISTLEEPLSKHETAGGVGAGHTYKTVWDQKIAGYTIHTFSSDFTQLKTDFISYQGSLLYSFTTTKHSAAAVAL